MEFNPDQWNNFQSYNHFEKTVDSIKVVNDCAERGVKVMTELNSSKDSEQRDSVQMVVNFHR